MKIQLIDDARGAWRHYSTRALALVTGLGGIWANLPDWVKTALPSWTAQAIAWSVFIIAALGLGGKFVDQSPKPPCEGKAGDQPQ